MVRTFLLLLAALSVTVGTRAAEPAFDSRNPHEILTQSPAMFLHGLTVKRDWVMTFVTPVKSWIRAEHIPDLISLLDSKEPCTPVVDAHSSFIPPSSTIGQEAAMMIDGFRQGAYPPALTASRYGEKEKQELRDWWQSQTRVP